MTGADDDGGNGWRRWVALQRALTQAQECNSAASPQRRKPLPKPRIRGEEEMNSFGTSVRTARFRSDDRLRRRPQSWRWQVRARCDRIKQSASQAVQDVGGCGWKASGGRQSNEGRCEEEPEEWWLDLDMCRNRQCCSRRVIRGGGVSSSRSGPKGDSVHLDLHGCMGTPPPTHEDRRGGPTAGQATVETEVHARSGVEFVQRRMGGHGRLRLPIRDARRACM